jgi:hypothetical protein
MSPFGGDDKGSIWEESSWSSCAENFCCLSVAHPTFDEPPTSHASPSLFTSHIIYQALTHLAIIVFVVLIKRMHAPPIESNQPSRTFKTFSRVTLSASLFFPNFLPFQTHLLVMHAATCTSAQNLCEYTPKSESSTRTSLRSLMATVDPSEVTAWRKKTNAYSQIPRSPCIVPRAVGV